MANLPLLLFPGKAKASRSKKSPFLSPYKYPPSERQGQRLSPKFKQLQEALRRRSIEFQQDPAGIEPEQALVMETIGSVDKFINAVKKIEGFEWLGEVQVDGIAPDDDFYNSKSRDKPLDGKLYMIMSDARAVDELLSMWNRWLKDKSIRFDHGLNKFKDIFKCLKDIRYWGVKDRLNETGILEAWKEELQHEGRHQVKFEIELWFRHSPDKRSEISKHIESLIKNLDGEVKKQCIIPEIAYHALLAELPANEIQSILHNPGVKLVECEGIMFFRQVGQISTDPIPLEEAPQSSTPSDHPLPDGDPVVGLLDGLPVSNHTFLAGRVVIDDPDDWLSQCKPGELRHGTAMASLVVHGDLSSNDKPLTRPVYVRPIIKPETADFVPGLRREHVPNTDIVVDLLHRAIRRIFRGDGDESATAPTIKSINLSVCDPARPFDSSMSPWARLLDWLSVEYNVLFIVSAGNQKHPIDLDIQSGKHISALSSKDRRKKVVEALYKNARNRRILSPAESINCLTIGAAHSDSSTNFNGSDRLDPLETLMPSSFSPFGTGYRKSIKPDLIYSGGRLLYRPSVSQHNRIEQVPALSPFPPGNKVACPVDFPGDLNRTIYACGTSNAAALITRSAAICYDTLIGILTSGASDQDFQNCVTSLLKAMLVHGCSWGEIEALISESLDGTINKSKKRDLISKWLGYGIPDIARVLECTEQRATILGFGNLSNGEAHVFDLPLPESLELKAERRKVTVTMAYNSPIIPTNQKYRQANLWFELHDKGLIKDRSDSQWQAVRRGTVQHEVFVGDKPISFPASGSLKIKVNCTEDAGKIEAPIPYGLIVSLEVAEGTPIPVYQEINSKIKPMVQISSASPTRIGS